MAGLALALLGLGASMVHAQFNDKVELVQKGVQSHTHGRESEGVAEGRLALLMRAAESMKSKSALNCTKYPRMCEAPFNCQKPHPEMPQRSDTPLAVNGHANLAAWCESPDQFNYIAACVRDHKLQKAARIQHRVVKGLGTGLDHLDASFCFSEGMCSNDAVTKDTTLEEAEMMCDARFTHARWADWIPSEDKGLKALTGPMKSFKVSTKNGYHDKRITQYYLKLACAMGNYHCDVMYCKETYCQDPYYIEKYQHLEPELPGHLIRELTD